MSNYECIGFRTARRLAHAGYTIICRETGEAWYWGAGTSSRRIRYILKKWLSWREDFFMADYTFKAVIKKWD